MIAGYLCLWGNVYAEVKMITCDRCQKRIKPDSGDMLKDIELVGEDDLVACLSCYGEYLDGLDKIKNEIYAEKAKRELNWLNQWQRNFKAEK